MRHLLILLVAASGLLAADVTGTWTGTFTPSGEEAGPAHLVLKQAGTVLTGTAGPSPEEQREIQHGKVENGVLTFEVTGKDTTMKFVLHQEGEELKGEATRESDGQHQSASVAVHRSPQH